MGDPAGIGPEIIAKAFARDPAPQNARRVVIGDEWVMRGAIGIVGAQLHVLPIGRIEEAIWQQGNIDVIDTNNVDYKDLQLGRVSATAGNAAFEAVKRAIELALAGSIDAVVTAPINKEALQLAGHRFPGHTEIFAHYTKTPDYTMMLAEGDLRVVHVSTHVSLLEACRAVTRDRVLKVIELANVACRQLGIDRPRIGVAGLNPHAGDGGLFGDEEQRHIIPAVEAARATGITVEGPLPADTLFAKALGGAFDICVAMYHDQGHIPVKMKGFRFDGASGKWESVSGINVSLGLPIIRTSVDHGTAFDQAGKGTASEMSLLNAIDYAARMSMAKRR